MTPSVRVLRLYSAGMLSRDDVLGGGQSRRRGARMSGPRPTLAGPFNALLRSPEAGGRWNSHKPAALKAGLTASVVDDLQAGRGLIGYCDLVSMVLVVDRHPLPAGATPPFPEPR